MSFIAPSNSQLLLFDDEPIESILYGEHVSEPSIASLFCDTKLHLDEIEATLGLGNPARGFELLRSYLHGDTPVPARACPIIVKCLQTLIPVCVRPLVPEPAMEHVDLAHTLVALAQRYEKTGAQHHAETIAYRWHEARGEYREARAIIARMRDRIVRDGDDLTLGILANNHAYEYLLEGDYEAAEEGFREALQLFEQANKRIEILNVQANILTCRFEILPENQWETLLPQLKEVHRGLARRHDWRIRKTMRLLAKRASARGRLSNAIAWARRAAAASEKVPTLLHREDQDCLKELEQGRQSAEQHPPKRARNESNGRASPQATYSQALPKDPTLPPECIMGLETEYAFTPFDRNGRPLNRTTYSRKLVSLAPSRLASLCGRDTYDLYLENGGRLYVDSGIGLINTEYATPECSSPAELVAHIRAGDLLLARLGRGLEGSEKQLGEAFISKCNFDYSGTTSGSHENYLHVTSQAKLAKELMPHLVSRIVYTGGGGFNDMASNIDFMLSPRVRFLEHAVSRGQQEARAIFTTKLEPLSRSRYGRLQLLCGEGVRCETSEYLRFGVTALLIRLVDLGIELSEGIGLDPLLAMNFCARDTECRARIGQIDGNSATALDIQRRYLHKAARHLGRPGVPDWATAVCEKWARVLDRLGADPMQLAGSLDWPTKLRLYRSFAEQKGFDWKTLADGSYKAPQQIRAALFEFDIRFGDISDESLFAKMTEDRCAGDTIVEEPAIETALTTPPQGTRARLRGEWIRKLSRNATSKRCGWDMVWDGIDGEIARFDDPYGA